MKSPRRGFILEGDRVFHDTVANPRRIPGPGSYEVPSCKKALRTVGVSQFGRTVRLTGQFVRDNEPRCPSPRAAIPALENKLSEEREKRSTSPCARRVEA